MSLTKGQRLGPYEIEAPAGKGGMGEVYRARDTRLDRTVAIKVLPSQTALDADSRARFEREARIISSLNHPHVCTLHDIGHEGGVDFLVLEFLEGEPLDERLKKGPLEVAEAMAIGAQLAGALYAAHSKGLVHRDLKPSNVFLTKEGAKLLDFGLAKLRSEVVAGMDEQTHTTPVTGAGALVGTLQYMSPEQLEGMEADARSDLFSFGATLYEFVTGQRAFHGDSRASLIGSIMKVEPRAVSEIRPTSPPALDRLIRKCLQKDPGKRWQTAGDLKDELEWIASAGSQAGIARQVASSRRVRLRLAWIVAIVCAIVAVVLSVQRLTHRSPDAPAMRVSIKLPDDIGEVTWPQVSPDGKYLAFVATDSSKISQIWLRPLGSNQARPISGTERAYLPCWSPDSKYLAYFEREEKSSETRALKKVPIDGGIPRVICEARGGQVSWGSQDILIFDGDLSMAIMMVPASGGEPRSVTFIDSSEGEVGHSWPSFLPDGRHFIYGVQIDSVDWFKVPLRVGCIDNKETVDIGVAESRAIYCSPGYLLFKKNGQLVAHPFDARKFELGRSEFLLSKSICGSSKDNPWDVCAGAADNGTIVWQEVGGKSEYGLVWLDRSGHVIDTVNFRSNIWGISLSPDDRRAAIEVGYAPIERTTLEILNLETLSAFPIQSGPSEQWGCRWSPDGQSVAYTAFGSQNISGIERCRIDDPSPTVYMASDSSNLAVAKWTDAGRLWCVEWIWKGLPKDTIFPRIITVDVGDSTSWRLRYTIPDWSWHVDLDSSCRFFLGIMPRGRVLYLYDLENLPRKWRLAADVQYACFSRSGREVFYFHNDDFMVLDVDLSGDVRYGTAKKLFSRPGINKVYDVSADGRRFLFVYEAKRAERTNREFEVFVNWHAELERGD